MQTDNKETSIDDFLVDPENANENESYIKPNIETKLPPHKRNECRDIVQEIRKFGISQRQFLYLIQLLALEIEDREIMLALTKVVGENREKIHVSNLVLDDK